MELLSKTETLSEKGNIAADSEDFQREADHLKNCLAIVRNNIDIYEQKRTELPKRSDSVISIRS